MTSGVCGVARGGAPIDFEMDHSAKLASSNNGSPCTWLEVHLIKARFEYRLVCRLGAAQMAMAEWEAAVAALEAGVALDPGSAEMVSCAGTLCCVMPAFGTWKWPFVAKVPSAQKFAGVKARGSKDRSRNRGGRQSRRGVVASRGTQHLSLHVETSRTVLPCGACHGAHVMLTACR